MKVVLSVYKNVSLHNLKKVYRYLKKYGFTNAFERMCGKQRQLSAVTYEEFVEQTKITAEQIEMRKTATYEQEPLISVIATDQQKKQQTDYQTYQQSFHQTYQQTYHNYEVIYVPSFQDEKAIVEVLQQCKGDYVVWVGEKDSLEPTALSDVVDIINKTNADIVYTDEDEYKNCGSVVQRCNPYMKPDYNVDLLRSCNYIGRLCFIRKSMVEELLSTGNGLSGAGTAWYYDLLLKCCEKADKIEHIAQVLLHCSWQAEDKRKFEMVDADRLFALNSHLERCGLHAHAQIIRNGAGDEKVDETIAGSVVIGDEAAGCDIAITKVVYDIETEETRQPLVSVIIPNKDHVDDLDCCIRSIEEQTRYKNYEILVVENNSMEPETFAYYKALQENHMRVRVIYWIHEFNYSAINNFGANYCKGDYLLFLNNDTRFRTDCITEMIGICRREDVGIVGAKMSYADNTIQSAGVIVGLKGVADSIMVGEPENACFHRARSLMCQNYSAVTAACMMTSREIFRETGGFCEVLPVAFNDIDYCLNVRRYGKLIVYTPYAKCYHFESKSRGTEQTFAQVKRFKKEIAFFLHEWKEFLEKGDPYYNVNLSLDRSDYSYVSNSKVNKANDLQSTDLQSESK